MLGGLLSARGTSLYHLNHVIIYTNLSSNLMQNVKDKKNLHLALLTAKLSTGPRGTFCGTMTRFFFLLCNCRHMPWTATRLNFQSAILKCRQ
jgi:hypothetical protein